MKIKYGPKKIGRENKKRYQGATPGGKAMEETKDHPARQHAATHSDVTGLRAVGESLVLV